MAEVGPPGMRGLWPLAAEVDDVSDPLLDPAVGPEEVRAGIEAVLARYVFVWLPLLSARFVQEVLPGDVRLRLRRSAQAMQVRFFPGESWESFAQRRFSSKERKKLRYEAGLLAGAETDTTTDPAAVARLLEVVRRVERHSWKASARRGFFSRPELPGFYREVFPLLAEEGRFRLRSLRQDGETLACELGTVLDGRYHLHHTVYREDAGKLSPGRHLLIASLQEARGEGLVFDFLQGAQAYKAKLATCAEPLFEATYFRAGVRGALLRRLIRPRALSVGD